MKEPFVYDARSLAEGTPELLAINLWNSHMSRRRDPSLADAHEVVLREIVPAVENFVRQKAAFEASRAKEGERAAPEGFAPDGTREIRVDDRPVRLRICEHCGAVPTEADAARAMANVETSCDVCKEKIRVTDGSLSHHSVIDGRSSWSGIWGREEHVELFSLGPERVDKRLHVRCYERVFGALPAR